MVGPHSVDFLDSDYSTAFRTLGYYQYLLCPRMSRWREPKVIDLYMCVLSEIIPLLLYDIKTGDRRQCIANTEATVRSRQNVWHFVNDFFKRFLLNEMVLFWFEFHGNMFPRVQLNLLESIGSDNGLAPDRLQTIILTKDDLIYWCI